MIRLVYLNPRWLGFDGERLGLSFECPRCMDQRLAVAFHRRGSELIDDAHIRAACGGAGAGHFIWAMEGAGFDDLTLTPSIDASASGHWHGSISGGLIV